MNKNKLKLSERQEAVLFSVAGVVLAMAIANTAHAQSIPLPFLDWVKNFFDGIRHHSAIPAVFACFLIGSVLIYTKTHALPALLGAIGCSVGIGVWAAQDSILSSIGYNG
jgi:hypothetical protein